MSMSKQQQAREAVERAGALYEQGRFPFNVYDGMRTALTNGHYGLVLRDFERHTPEGQERAALREENAALREIAQALVDFDNKGDGMDDNQRDLYEVCFLPLVEKARAVLADDDEPVS